MEASAVGRDFDRLRVRSIRAAERIYVEDSPDPGFASPVHGVEAAI